MIQQLLRDFSSPGVTVFTSRDVGQQLSTIESILPGNSDTTLLVGQIWERIPERDVLIREIALLLAQSALVSWPYWYDETVGLPHKLPDSSKSSEPLVDSDERVKHRASLQRNVLPEWLDQAILRCNAQRSPLLKHYSIEMQLRQLAIAMPWQHFVHANISSSF